ncbi:hypothetical protein [Halomonas salipaludis]|nr:hypothetical protein [Halomonas salipaludis]
MVNYTYYSYRIYWSAEDDQFVGQCAELPSLSWLANSQREALDGVVTLVADAMADMQAEGEIPPQPLA